jgi:hypothetical protein
MTDIKDKLHNLMQRSGWQSREDQETIFAAVQEIEQLRAALDDCVVELETYGGDEMGHKMKSTAAAIQKAVKIRAHTL